MTRAPRLVGRTFALATSLALTTTLTACSGTPELGAEGDPASTSPTRTPSASPDESASPSADPSESHDADDHELERPATQAGPLSRKDFPRPRQLGAGWQFSVDQGSAEDGYVGNGTPALARDPGEVVQLAVPLGCPRPRKMPVPEFALEVDYTVGGTKVIAVRGEFKDQGTAEIFFGARAANLQRCLGRSGSEAIGPLVTTARAVADDVLLSDRTPESAPWAELAVRDGDQVVLVAAQSRLGRPPMTPAGARRLAEVFRR